MMGSWNPETNTCPCGCWNRYQHDWKALCEKVGEAAAAAEVVRRLRQAADHIESGKQYPAIFGCSLPEGEQICANGNFMETIAVILSYPWPG